MALLEKFRETKKKVKTTMKQKYKEIGLRGFVKEIKRDLPPSLRKGKKRPKTMRSLYGGKNPKIPKFF